MLGGVSRGGRILGRMSDAFITLLADYMRPVADGFRRDGLTPEQAAAEIASVPGPHGPAESLANLVRLGVVDVRDGGYVWTDAP